MVSNHWYAPLDPDCPVVEEYHKDTANDPIMRLSGCAGEFYESFASKHRSECKRCQEYGAANIEIG